MLSRFGEVVLSYLQGLAPVGEEVCPTPQQLIQDLRMIGCYEKAHRNSIYQAINSLVERGHVEIVRRGGGTSNPSVYRVKTRLEDYYSEMRKRRRIRDVERPLDFVARKTVPHQTAYREMLDKALVDLPKYDLRSLTGYLMGDPLPERSALARRQVVPA